MSKQQLINWRGNRKVPCPIFNLPAVVTCPGAGQCGSSSGECYALRTEVRRPKVRAYRLRNLAASKDPGFVAAVIDEIQRRQQRRGRLPAYFRIHESGDFYSLAYFRKWCEIARAFPAVTFFAYTKSYFVWREARPANLSLLASQYLDTDPAKLPMMAPVFETVPRGSIGNGFHCPGYCGGCWAYAHAAPMARIWIEKH